ncbi:nucleotide disphospho-sugar-binding domain-containing protein [Azotobacter vinelandii]|uniref:nucleotide disphospho-sugar-binding domain-containing protein n=1 Tax=Azotobacter vinelandii TaxID=354 RepID=UPI002665AC04|nr:glycosyltransferase [Azotobacter vinelandii]WKN24381.1 glycosyltransferase [Azotobacter vinelandii]
MSSPVSNAVPTILLILCPERSSFNASFVLARRLKAMGYRILYSGPERWQDYIEAQGFDYRIIQLESFGEPEPDSGLLTQWQYRRRQLRHYRQAANRLLAKSEAELAREKPVLLLIDPLIGVHSLLVVKSGIPAIALNTTLASTYDVGIPPAFCDLLAEKSPRLLSRLRFRVAWWRCLWRSKSSRWLLDVLQPLALALPPRRSLVAQVKRLGGSIRWGEYGPCLAVPEFVLSPRELDFPTSAAASPRTYVGACVDLQRQDESFEWDGIDPDKPLLYCSLGTYNHAYPHATRLFRAVVEALCQREDWQAIVQVGDALPLDFFGSLPPRIRLVGQVPQLRILASADVFVTHGGFSSVRESLLYGVPMLVFPCWLDQPGNAARVVHHGLGLQGDIAKVDSHVVLDLLQRIETPHFKKSALWMQAIFQAQIDCQAGVEFIQHHLGKDLVADPKRVTFVKAK